MFRRLFARSPVGAVVLGMDFGFRWCNEAFCRFVGYGEGELTDGMTLLDITFPADRSAGVKEARELARDGQGRAQAETRYIRKDGRTVWGAVSMGAVTGSSGDGALWAFVEDISERKRAEQEMSARAAQLSLVHDHAQDIVFSLAVEGDDLYRFVWANRRFLEARRLSEAQVVGKLVQEVVPLSALKVALGKWREAIQTRRAVDWRQESVYHTGSTEEEVTVVPVFDERGRCAQLITTVRDATKREHTEAQLLESWGQRAIVETAMDGFALIDAQGRLLAVNETYTRMSGYSRDELLGKSVTDLDAMDGPVELRARIARLAAGGDLRFETKHRRKDGSVYDVEVSAQYRPERDGRVVAFIRDITERKRSEAALRRSAEWYHALFDQASDGIFVVDLRGAILSVNEEFARMHGMTIEEVRRRGLGQIDVRGLEYATGLLRGVVSGERVDFEVEHYHGDGHIFPVAVTARVISWGNEQVVLAIHRDITERKRAEAALKASEEKYSKVFRDAPVWIAITDLEDGTFLEVNEEALRAGGFSREEVIGHRSTEIGWIAPEDRARMVGAVKQTGQIGGMELSFRTKQGEVLRGIVSGETIEIGGRKCLLTVTVDITERRRAETALSEIAEQRRALLETAMDGFLMSDMEGRIVDVNETYCRMSGYDRAEVIGRGLHELRASGGASDVAAHLQWIKREGQVRYEVRHRRRDGSLYDIEVSAQYRDEGGGRAVAFVRDVTERRRSETALRESEAKYAKVFHESPVMKAIVDMESRVLLEVNRELLRVSGSEREEVIGRTASELGWIRKEDADLLVREVRAKGRVTGLDLTLRRKDKRAVLALVNVEAMEIGGRKCAFVAAIDVTERKTGEVYREMGREVLQVLNETPDWKEAVRRVVSVLKRNTGCDAVGIRLQDGEDFPFFAHEGLGADFVRQESELVERDVSGGAVRDANGEVSLECACGLVLSGRVSPEHPQCSAGGSFWTNDSSEVLEMPTGQDPRRNPRNRCMRAGYASLALTPIRTQQGVVGLVHLADRRKGCFAAETVAALETISAHIGAALVHKKAEEALRASEEKYRQLVESSYEIVYSMSVTGILTFVSPACKALLGYEPEAVVSQPFPKFVHPDDIPQCERWIAELAATGERRTGMEFRIRHANGSWRWFSTSGTPFRDEHGRVTGMQGTARDVTERRLTQAALRESEANFRAFFESTMDMVFVATREGRILVANPEVSRALGYSARELAGKEVAALCRSETWREDEHALEKMLSGRHESSALVMAHKDGADVPVEMRARLGRWNGRECLFVVCKNLTTEVEAQQRFERLFRRNPTLMALSDLSDLTFVDVNDAFLATLGVTREQVIGKTAVDLGLFPNPDEQLAAARELLNRGSFRDHEIKVHCRNGEALDGLFSGEVILSRGKPFVLTVMIDITARKRAEDSLRESQARFRELVSQSPLSIQIFDPSGKVVQVNGAFEKMWGVTLDRFEGYNILRDPELERLGLIPLMQKAFSGEVVEFPVVEFDAKVAVAEGRKRVVQTIAYPIRDQSGAIREVTVVHQDVTDRVKAEQERSLLTAQLQQAQKMESVGRLAGGVAHDFNNMLGVIIGHADLAMAGTGPAHPLYGDLTEIRKAAERSANLTRQLLAFARKQTVSPRVVDLNEVVGGMLKMLRRLIGEDISLEWHPGQSLWTTRMDPSQVDQILANLCVNARDAINGTGRIEIETANCVLGQDFCAVHAGAVPGEYVRLAVSDSGCGMSAEVLAHVFEPFFTTKPVGSGTGLGLATVYGAVKQNNGFVEVASAPGKGARFTVFLPRHTEKAVSVTSEGGSGPGAHAGETILVVEDEPAILQLTRTILGMQGYKVLTAATPGEAIQIAREHPGEIHLLLTDVVMPEMNGRELAKNLLKVYPNMKRVFMSGYTADVIAHHGVLEEGVMFVEKPCTAKDLAAKVREALDA